MPAFSRTRFTKCVQLLRAESYNGYRNPDHQQRLSAIGREVGFEQVSLSNELRSFIKQASQCIPCPSVQHGSCQRANVAGRHRISLFFGRLRTVHAFPR